MADVNTHTLTRPARPAAPSRTGAPAAAARPQRDNARRSATLDLGIEALMAAGGLAIGFENPARQEPERILPYRADPTYTVPGANAWSAWQQVATGQALDYVLAGINIAYAPLIPGSLHLQIGIGAAGSETPIHEFGMSNQLSGTGATPFIGLYERTPYIKIAAGARIALRAYWDRATDPPFVGVYLALLPSPPSNWQTWSDDWALGDRALTTARTPAVPSFTAIAAAGYTTIIPAAPNDMLLYAVTKDHSNVGAHAQVKLATGAAGSEVVHAIMPMAGPFNFFRAIGFTMPARPILIYAGERVALGFDYNSTSAALNCAVYMVNIA